MVSRRRNGKPASCEPCRKDKVRCDHRLPVCSRCQKRRLTAHCFYHPAPLTRNSKQTQGVSRSRREHGRPNILPEEGSPILRSLRAATEYTSTPPDSEEPDVHSDDPFCLPDRSLPTGYLGPTSFVAALEEDQELVSSPSDLPPQDRAFPPGLPSYWVRKTAEILYCLKDFSTIQQVVREYYRISPAAIVLPLVLHALPAIQTMIDETQLHKGSLDQVALVLRNTSQVLQIPSTTKGSEFYELFTGPNLRLEILGFFYAIAGRMSVFGLAYDKFPGRGGPTTRQQFARKMFAVSDAVLQVCKILTPVNDLTIWLLYETLLLSNIVHNDSSSARWHRLGDLSTHIFELGLHRDSQQNDLPIFLRELRRRSFAAAYQLDKSIATFLGRPPRISMRHSDCRLPLDISESTFEASEPELELALQCLDNRGWSTQGVFQLSSFIRQRFLLSTFREEILEISSERPSPETADKLRDISLRCHQTWNSFPKYLRYHSDYEDNIPVTIHLMLMISYLTYLYNDFLIHRLLVSQGQEAQTALLDVSSTILATVLAFGTLREDMVDLRPDFKATSLLYGFPSAIVLAKALQNQARTGKPIPYEGSRSVLIRNLSVFISHLELMARSDTSHELFDRTSKLFSNIIDEVLEPRVAVTLPGPELDSLADIGFDMIAESEDLNFLDILDLGGSIDQMIF